MASPSTSVSFAIKTSKKSKQLSLQRSTADRPNLHHIVSEAAVSASSSVTQKKPVVLDLPSEWVQQPETETKGEPLLLVKQVEGVDELTTYDSVAISDFGTGYLRALGWEVGRPIGKNATEVVQPIEYIPRHHRLGLGASARHLARHKSNKKKQKRNGHTGKEAKPVMHLRPDEDGRKRSYRTLDEKLTEYKPVVMEKGALVLIQAGLHKGLYAKVVHYHKVSPAIVVQFSNEQTATVPLKDVKLIDQNNLPASHPALTVLQPKTGERGLIGLMDSSTSSDPKLTLITQSTSKRKKPASSLESPSIKKSKHGRTSSPLSSRDKSKKKKKKKKYKMDVEETDSWRHLWVQPNITVRIISKKFDDGKHYLKKVRVVDVPSKNNVIVDLGGGKILEGLTQSMLETALPKSGGRVMVISGPHKMKSGTLMSRNSKTGKASVQLDEDLDIETFSFDDIAERAM